MKILVSGSSGLIGSALVDFLTLNGHEVIKLVRTRANLKHDELAWDLNRGIINPEALEGIDGVVHLAGESIANGRWTEAKKQRILDSRVKGTRDVAEALAGLKNPPKVFVSGSAIGYYGSRGNEILTESSLPGVGFLPEVCKQWEAATKPAIDKGIRVVNLRTGIVLSPKGGVLKQMLIPFKMFLGGKIGSGDQYMSWIAINDLIQAIYFALRNEAIRGPLNAVGPHPVTNRLFTETLGKVLERPTFMTMPAFMAELVLGEMADELLLSSTRVTPSVLIKEGFKFNYPDLETTLKELIN